MPTPRLTLPAAVHRALGSHLLGHPDGHEEAAFVFADVSVEEGVVVFEYAGHRLVPPDGFELRSAYYLELTDNERAGAIKRAHDMGTTLVEMHSHPFQGRAGFSPSDIAGLREFVPHVRWRLRKKPYAALVLGRKSFDALAWTEDGPHPVPLSCDVDGNQLRPTGESLRSWRLGGCA